MVQWIVPLLMAGLAALCAEPASAANRLALVVGNDGYRHVAPLKNARNDARLLARMLRDARFEITTVEDADRAAMWRALDAFSARIREGDEVVFFFAGHGVQIGSDPVLLPVDIQAEHENQVLREGVLLHKVQDALKQARVALIIIDACRNNPLPQRATRSIGESRGLLAVEAAEGMAVLMAAGRGQAALDAVPGTQAANGLFTHTLAQVLRTPGIGVRSALMLARDRVETEARKVGHLQRPALVDEMRGDFHLFAAAPAAAPGRPALPSEEEIELQGWEAAQAAANAAAYDAYLREYPRGRYAAAARVRLAGLAISSAKAAAGYTYRVTDLYTRVSQTHTHEGDAAGTTFGGVLDGLRPAGGWVTAELLDKRRASLRYRSADDTDLRLDAEVLETREVEVPAGRFEAIHLRYAGNADLRTPNFASVPHRADISLWYSPKLARVIAYEVQMVPMRFGSGASPGMARERAELVSIR